MKVSLVSVTEITSSLNLPPELQSAEGLMAYTARVSSPKQDNTSYAKLLAYCIKHQHWSIFEMVDMTLEITTSRAIAQQILRHKSFSFQEFSQRYAKADLGFETYEARRQDNKNRQNSINDMPEETKQWFLDAQKSVQTLAQNLYDHAIEKDIAKEQARFLLPIGVTTKLYMKGSVRSWIHYIGLRSANGTQKEHQDIALAAMEIFKEQFPITYEALNWGVEKEST